MIVSDIILTSWLRESRTGDTLVYARATYLVPNSVTRRLFDLAESGHVTLTRTRRMHGPGDENFLYGARRLAKPLAGFGGSAKSGAKGGPASRRKPQDARMSACAAMQREILPQVREMLAEGLPRNGNAIARDLGLYSAAPVYQLLRRLAA